MGLGLALSGCGSDSQRGGPQTSSPEAGPEASQPDAGSPPVDGGVFRLDVRHGYGSGLYPEGATVHVWSALLPTKELLVRWEGDSDLLERPGEWHTTLRMPARDVNVDAIVESRPDPLKVATFEGTTAHAKTIRYAAPANPLGLMLLLHGTGGSSAMAEKPESKYLVLSAMARGYAVVAPEAEEVAQGDMNNDGKVRWNPGLTSDNVDLANLNELILWARTQGLISAATPLYVVGMSNGGAMSVSLGAVAASDVAASFPALRFAAAVSYCASGRSSAAATTTTPTAWLLCAHDDNDEVSNEEAYANSASLEARGIDTEVDAHPATPLNGARFTRVEGVSEAESEAIVGELTASGFVGTDGLFTVPTDDIIAAVQNSPEAYPTLAAMPGGILSDVVDQVRVMQAEHQLYSDWAARTMDFLDAHRP